MICVGEAKSGATLVHHICQPSTQITCQHFVIWTANGYLARIICRERVPDSRLKCVRAPSNQLDARKKSSLVLTQRVIAWSTPSSDVGLR
jgi:hypothetical protein